jgi:hypothetical protein
LRVSCLYPYYAYKLAREFLEGYKPQYGTGLIPESVPMLLEVALVLVSVLFWTKFDTEVSQFDLFNLNYAVKAE